MRLKGQTEKEILMKESKKNGIIDKIGFSFTNSSKSEKEGTIAVLEHDTFECSEQNFDEQKMSYEDEFGFYKNSTTKNMKHIANIINGLANRTDFESIGVLEEIGTNSAVDTIREMTVRALVRKNVPEALNVVIGLEGKGINDLSTAVAMSAINELLGLQNKEFAMQVLEETIANTENEEIRGNARSVKALMALC